MKSDQWIYSLHIYNLSKSKRVLKMISKKRQQFANFIRKNQRERIFSSYRRKMNQNKCQKVCPQDQWDIFIKDSGFLVPEIVCEAFWEMSFQIIELRECINRLQPSAMPNIYFCAQCLIRYKIQSPQILESTVLDSQRTLEDLQTASATQKGSLFSCPQNTNILYWCAYLDCYGKICYKNNEQILAGFRNYWENCFNVLDYELSSYLATLLLDCCASVKILPLARRINYWLIGSGHYSRSVYMLAASLLEKDLSAMLQVILHPNFVNFIDEGVQKINTITNTLTIIHLILERDCFAWNSKIDYSNVAEKILAMYVSKDCPDNIRSAILLGFFSFLQSNAVDLRIFFAKIDFDEIYFKTSEENMMSFLEFCIEIGLNYAEQGYSWVFEGKKFCVVGCFALNFTKWPKNQSESLLKKLLLVIESNLSSELALKPIAQGLHKILDKIFISDPHNCFSEQSAKFCQEVLRAIDERIGVDYF